MWHNKTDTERRQKMIKVKVAIAIFCLCLLAGTGCKEKLNIDLFPGVDIEKIICFNSASGDIIWECSRHEIREYALPSASSVIGLGHFSEKERAVIFFEYNSSKNLLTSSIARNITCECCKNLFKGEVLEVFKSQKAL